MFMLKNKNVELYRPGVGLMILNPRKEIFLGRRNNESKKYWQMPQGGIEKGETPINAAMREMQEEVGTNNCKILAETKKWNFYTIPFRVKSSNWDQKYVGQMQKWFLVKFLGNDLDIDILSSNIPEFKEWKWENSSKIIELAVPFKRRLYASVINEFNKFF